MNQVKDNKITGKYQRVKKSNRREWVRVGGGWKNDMRIVTRWFTIQRLEHAFSLSVYLLLFLLLITFASNWRYDQVTHLPAYPPSFQCSIKTFYYSTDQVCSVLQSISRFPFVSQCHKNLGSHSPAYCQIRLRNIQAMLSLN